MQKKACFVVIGSGGAGMAAAVTAMQCGVKNIVILEKSPFLGGNSRMAGGDIHTVYPQGGPGNKPSVDETFREAMAFHHYRMVEPKILRAFLDETSNTLDFLRGVGVPYSDTGVIGGRRYPFGDFYRAIKVLERVFLEEESNEILRNTAATRILTDAAGKVCGVEAKDGDGNTFTIETTAAAITTGGFTGNSDLLHRYFPEEYDDCFYTDALPLQGDGIGLARSAGAALSRHCTLVKENGYSCDSRLDAPNRSAHNPYTIWINSYGERFLDESHTMGNETTNALVRQPDMIGYALFDSNILRATEEKPVLMMPGGDDDATPMPGGDGHVMPSTRESLENEYRRGEGWVEKADSMEELAQKLGVDPETLVHTMEEYNGYCKNGRDGLFAKDEKYLVAIEQAPFYALKFRPILIETQGPIVVNERMEVLNEAHKPIPGLYAGGVCTAGCQGTDYHLRGANLSYAVTSGRIIGRTAEAYLS